tara:strand:- start:477 stop:926 length:450 start_codon:yes stop_codon:yes gene_type:complete
VDKAKDKADLIALIEPLIVEHGVELVDIELSGNRGSQLVRILVHRDLGVTLGLCESISREVADLFDVEDPLTGSYRLEVTSPGLDRPLETDGDFTRAENHLIKVVLNSGQVYKGRLINFDSDQIWLEPEIKTPSILRADIAKAFIEPEL